MLLLWLGARGDGSLLEQMPGDMPDEAADDPLDEGQDDDAPLDDLPDVACPAAPADMLMATLPPMGGYLLQSQLSGQILAIPVPDNGLNSMVVFSESPAVLTPEPVTLEISVHRCPGVIDTDATNPCNVSTWTPHMVSSVTFFMQAVGPYTAYCWAGDPDTQYFINARWTYDACGFGASTCGFSIGSQNGPG